MEYRIYSAALIKYIMPQAQRLFEGSAFKKKLY